MAGIWEELRTRIRGEVQTSEGMRGAYATDASVYQEFPKAVAFPHSSDDVARLLEFCREHGVPIIARGGGTSLSGQAIGAGLVIDYSRHMNRLVKLDLERRLVCVEPGLVLDDLNRRLISHGLHFAPDPATASRATIGGMIGNNSCGTRSIVYGRTSDSIEMLRGLLSDGSNFETCWLTSEEWKKAEIGDARVNQIYCEVRTLLARYGQEIKSKVPTLPRIVAGYSLQSLLDESRPRSLSDLVCGSEGTLALVNQATLRLRPLPAATCLVISAFDSLGRALESLPVILSTGPSAVELLDQILIKEAVNNAATRAIAQVIAPSGTVPFAVQMVEYFGDSPLEAKQLAENYILKLAKSGTRAEHRILETRVDQQRAWDVRRLGLGLISNLPGKAKAIALIEDACLPIESLPAYNRFVFETGLRMGLGISTYAHASVGVLHYKVMLDLHTAEDRRKMRAMAEACFEKCRDLGGVFSGEHGDGIVRGEFLPRQFGPEIYRAFVELKRLFDPHSLLNPGRKIDSPPLDGPLRYGVDQEARETYVRTTSGVTSHFQFRHQGGLVGAIEQCNGVGACRQLWKGTMCPSYRATRDERDSTRGRANLLRLAISGQMNPPGLANSELHGALDLCLACKACKSECPNAVDLARLKSEALQAKWDLTGQTRSARFIGAMPERIAAASRFGFVARWAAGFRLFKSILQKRYGIDSRRNLPMPAPRSFDAWWKRHPTRESPGRTVVLFVDAWNRYLEPEIPIAAVELLESCGFRVEVSSQFDALRTRISVGQLREAKKLAKPLFQDLEKYSTRGWPLLFLEPSEASSIVDDLPDLLDDREIGDRVAANATMLDDFLAAEIRSGRVQLDTLNSGTGHSVVVHPHCHQRALFGATATVEILNSAGFETELADWGCCGMAGSFGYTHFDVSRQVAELSFAPGIGEALKLGRTVVATGTSCRQQAMDFCHYRPLHWVQLVGSRNANPKGG